MENYLINSQYRKMGNVHMISMQLNYKSKALDKLTKKKKL